MMETGRKYNSKKFKKIKTGRKYNSGKTYITTRTYNSVGISLSDSELERLDNIGKYLSLGRSSTIKVILKKYESEIIKGEK